MADLPDDAFDDDYLDLYHEPPTDDELYGTDFDPATSPPEGWEVMSDAQRRELLGDDNYPADPAEDPDEDAFGDLIEAGFAHRDPQPGATGFRAGGPLDVMLPGEELAWYLGAARQRGLGQLSDDELIGVLAAARRVQSWQVAVELAATAELDARRAAPGGREGEHVTDELAAALTLTGRSAQAQLDLSRQLERLPHTAGLLENGIIDRSRAAVIASHLTLLNDADAAAVDAVIAAKAGQQTTGQLSARCHRAVLAHDPLAYQRRKKHAEKNARVECWTEHTGTAALAGRDLDRAAAIAADKSLDEAARWLQRQHVQGTMDQLRSAVFLARVTGQPLHTFLPPQPTTGTAGASGAAGESGAADASGAAGAAGASGAADASGVGGASGASGAAAAGPAPGPGDAAGPRPWPAAAGGPGTGPAAGQDPAALSGINLTVPLATWLGLSDRPGEITGTGAAGPADAGTCRQLTNALARNPDTRWCLTMTDQAGRAIAHGCARAGPGPPGTDHRAWLASVTITPIETATCAHRYQSAAYQPSPTLRHRVKIRSPRCGFPGCRQPATRCDDDHTIPHHKGGRTCECNLHPLCRHHHQTKQAHGWHLAQPEPGVLVWTAPSGRTYTVTPGLYPA